ncbi:LacI family DNA-binding transcriptional regulator [Aerococcaceae bacterium DSM 111022]|nr:LacI family DNA-binding transcriptional regulator [Aerococcaceae bacterium DSM 111022]
MVGMKEVAKRAGVSVGAVSLALNNKKGVSEETRNRILKVAEEMQYKYTVRVDQDKTNAPYNIRLVIVSKNMVVSNNIQTQPFFSTLINNILSLSNHKTVSISLSFVQHEDLKFYIEKHTEEKSIDGIILLSTDLDAIDLINTVDDIKLPIVLLDSSHKLINLNQIGINNKQGATIAADYILSKGFKRIGYAMSENRIHNFEERYDAFMSRLKSNGLSINNEDIYKFSPNFLEVNNQIKEKMKKPNDIPAVFFCENDAIAISLVKTLQELSYKIPEDVSIIGFDDIPESVIISPELTTISVDKANFAKLAINQIIGAIENNSPYQIMLNCTLVERASS